MTKSRSAEDRAHTRTPRNRSREARPIQEISQVHTQHSPTTLCTHSSGPPGQQGEAEQRGASASAVSKWTNIQVAHIGLLITHTHTSHAHTCRDDARKLINNTSTQAALRNLCHIRWLHRFSVVHEHSSLTWSLCLMHNRFTLSRLGYCWCNTSLFMLHLHVLIIVCTHHLCSHALSPCYMSSSVSSRTGEDANSY